MACNFSWANDSTITITDSESSYLLNARSWSKYGTTDKSITIEDAIRLYKTGAFSTINAPVFNGGIASRYYWFHFSVVNHGSAASKLIVDVQSPRLNELELFEVSEESARSLGNLGDFYPFEQRTLLHKNFQYEVTLESHQQKDYYLFVNQVGHTFLLPVHIYKDRTFEKTVNQGYLTDGITYGLLLFVAIFSFLFFINTKHNLYLYYGLYILTSIVWFLGFFGLGFEFVWPSHPAINTIAAPFFAAINLFLNIQISQVLLELRTGHRLVYKAGNVFKVLLVAVAIFPVIVNLNYRGYSTNNLYLCVFLTVIVGSIIIVFISLVAALARGTLAAKYYFTASILKVGSIFNLALLEWGISPGLYYIEGMLQIGILIEIVLLTYAIARRYTSYKLKTYQKIIQAQENERFNSAKEIHDSISGTLTAVRYKLLSLLRNEAVETAGLKKDLTIICDDVSTAQLEARNISHNLMPAYIKDNSLNRVIDLYIDDLQKKLNTGQEKVTIQFLPTDSNEHFSEEVRLNIFRIVQEIMTNIIKHAHASNVTLEFTYKKKDLIIVAEDDGVGFDNATIKDKKGIGLRNIESRVQLLNGTIQMTLAKRQSADNNKPGTRTTIRIPTIQHSGRDSRDY